MVGFGSQLKGARCLSVLHSFIGLGYRIASIHESMYNKVYVYYIYTIFLDRQRWKILELKHVP